MIAKKREDNYQPKSIVRTAKDLGDPNKFGIADVKEFSALLQSLDSDITDLKQLRAGYSKALRELETAMLKGLLETKSKASSDAHSASQLQCEKRKLFASARLIAMPSSLGCSRQEHWVPNI